jgi:hypothetical protein
MGARMRKACPCSLQINNLKDNFKDNNTKEAIKRAAGSQVELQL